MVRELSETTDSVTREDLLSTQGVHHFYHMKTKASHHDDKRLSSFNIP